MTKFRLFAAAAALTVALSGCGGDRGPDKTVLTKEDFTNPPVSKNPLVDYTKWSVHDGKFFLDGKWVFIKTAKPLTDFPDPGCCQRVIDFLDILREKHYNAVSLDLSWSNFDRDGDGVVDVSVEPLIRLIDAIYDRGMYPCLCLEDYAVGGGRLPEGFWEQYPDAYAINSAGQRVTDTEYGFGSKVVSLFHDGYLEKSRSFIKDLLSKIDCRKILFFETNVEPQYMGSIKLCYSDAAKAKYAAWRKANGITDKDSEMPEGFPVPDSFVSNPVWNKFRAQYLASWVNGDAEAIRSVAGKDARIAVDYLDAGESSMMLRCGIPEEFLRSLTCANIIQVNWHWYFPERKPNDKAYERVHKIMAETGRDWAITEHMTFNGSDYGFSTEVLDAVLENTLHQGTRFGWDFTNTFNRNTDAFSLYNNDWSPKRTIKNVDDNWGYWMYRVKKIESEINGNN